MLDEGFLYPREECIRLNKAAKDRLWGMITERDGGKCVYCKLVYNLSTPGWHHHHVRPKGQHGGDTADNVVLLCMMHHTGNEKESAHGERGREVRKILEGYLASDYVKEWIEAHRDELEEIYAHRYVQPHKRKRRKK